MTTHPVRVTARQWVYLAKTVDMPEQDDETWLSIYENCRDVNEQDGCLGDIAARYRINVFEPIQHTDALEDIIFEHV